MSQPSAALYAGVVSVPSGLGWAKPQAMDLQGSPTPPNPGLQAQPAARYQGFRSAGVQDMSTFSTAAGSSSAKLQGSSATSNGPGPPGGPPAYAIQAPTSHQRHSSRLAAAEAVINAQWRAAQQSSTASSRLGPKLSQENVGYRLLKLAGWREGQGLGSQEQGRVVPIDAMKNPGARGIGFERRPHVQSVRGQTGEAEAGAGISGTGAGEEQERKRARIAELVDQELAGESTETKVAIHTAQAQAAAEAARGRAIQRALYRAFDDPFDNVGAATANHNPLRGRNRLTATNPLLDSDDDQ